VAKDRVERDEEDLVRLYLTDIGQYTLLTKDDEVRLAKQIEAGKAAIEELDQIGKELTAAKKRELRRASREGEDAERAFVQSNLRLVVSIAKKYQASGLPLLDLIQEGNLGLMHAVEKFDWRKGFKFSTYATWWIRQSVGRAVHDYGRTIRLPVHVIESLNKLSHARAALVRRCGREPRPEEVAIEMGVPIAKVLLLLDAAKFPTSLEAPVGEEETEVGRLIPDVTARSPEEEAMRGELAKEIEHAMEPLNDREREVMRLRYGLGLDRELTLEEIGRRLSLTRERIRQIEMKALSKMRTARHRVA